MNVKSSASAISFLLLFFGATVIAHAIDLPLRGYVWSSNIGWIQFQDTTIPYEVTADSESGGFSGYAWSSNVGWMSFNRTTAGAPPTDPFYKQGKGMTGYWEFDEGSGVTAFDSSGNSNNGNLINGPAWVSGKSNGALRFDGVDDAVGVPSSPTLFTSPDFSISLWAKPLAVKTVANGGCAAVGADGAYCNLLMGMENYLTTGFRFGLGGLGGQTDTRLSFWTTQSGGTLEMDSGATQLILNQWNHVAVTYNSSTQTGVLHINGVQVGSGSGTYIPPVGRNLTIAGDIGGTGGSNSVLDEIRIFSRSLGPGEVATLYNLGSALGYWKLDETSGNFLDASGNGNTGTPNFESSGDTLGYASDGMLNKGVRFNGLKSHIKVDDPGMKLAPRDSMTVELWANPLPGYGFFISESPGAVGLVSKRPLVTVDDGSWGGLWVDTDTGKIWGRLYFKNTSGSTVSIDIPKPPQPLEVNKWSHIALVVEKSTGQISLYVNGVRVANVAYNNTFTLQQNTDPLYIGRQWINTTPQVLYGNIDEVRIYDRPLYKTEQEVRDAIKSYDTLFGPIGQLNLNTDPNRLEGWARFLTYGDGWNGWVNFSDGLYGVVRQNDKLKGYAWSDNVVGWISFEGKATNNAAYGVTIAKANSLFSATLSADPISGVPPLTTTLTARAFSSLAGETLRFEFDCQDDGVVDAPPLDVLVTNPLDVTAAVTCTYDVPNAGGFPYVARVFVEQLGFLGWNANSITSVSVNAEGFAAFGQPLKGFAWSSNVGWISFSGKANDGTPYGVFMDELSGKLTGFAWAKSNFRAPEFTTFFKEGITTDFFGNQTPHKPRAIGANRLTGEIWIANEYDWNSPVEWVSPGDPYVKPIRRSVNDYCWGTMTRLTPFVGGDVLTFGSEYYVTTTRMYVGNILTDVEVFVRGAHSTPLEMIYNPDTKEMWVINKSNPYNLPGGDSFGLGDTVYSISRYVADPTIEPESLLRTIYGVQVAPSPFSENRGENYSVCFHVYQGGTGENSESREILSDGVNLWARSDSGLELGDSVITKVDPRVQDPLYDFSWNADAALTHPRAEVDVTNWFVGDCTADAGGCPDTGGFTIDEFAIGGGSVWVLEKGSEGGTPTRIARIPTTVSTDPPTEPPQIDEFSVPGDVGMLDLLYHQSYLWTFDEHSLFTPPNLVQIDPTDKKVVARYLFPAEPDPAVFFGGRPHEMFSDGRDIFMIATDGSITRFVTEAKQFIKYQGLARRTEVDGWNPIILDATFDGKSIWTVNEDGTVTRVTIDGKTETGGIGWINFNPEIIQDDPSHDPDLANPSDVSARVDVNTGKFEGWARACSVYQSGCSGSLKTLEERGGWDGWIKLAGTPQAPTGPAFQSFGPTGLRPQRMVYIPETGDIWTANQQGRSLTQITPAGEITTLDISPLEPIDITYDGLNLWIADFSNLIVARISPRKGTVLNTYSISNNPFAIAFDGKDLWVTIPGVSDSEVLKMSTDGAAILSVPTGRQTRDVLFDGTYIWVANERDNSVTKIALNGAVIGTYGPTGSTPTALAFDGSHIWTANFGDNSVTKITRGGRIIGTYVGTGAGPQGITYDGSFIWTANSSGNSVTRIAQDGTMTTYTDTALGGAPTAILYNPNTFTLWTANATANTATEITPPFDAYGVILNGDKLQGFAWGDDFLGWISFCDPRASGTHCVSVPGGQINLVTLAATPKYGFGSASNVAFDAEAHTPSAKEVVFNFFCYDTNVVPDHTSPPITPVEDPFNTNNSIASYSSPALCDYPSAGNYTAKVEAEQGTAMGAATVLINVAALSLTANPNSGSEPLSVILTAEVNGAVLGPNSTENVIFFSFDCNGNGVVDEEDKPTKAETISSSNTTIKETFTCTYSEGSYTARVKAQRCNDSKCDFVATGFAATSLITVESASIDAVTLQAIPNSGRVPLNDVDLKADVTTLNGGGTPFTYTFDCGNGTPALEPVTTNDTTYTAVDACDYSTAGLYTAKVTVTRGTNTKTATAIIRIFRFGEVPP